MKKLFAVILSLGLILAPIPTVNTAHAGGAGGYAKMILGMANGIMGSTILTKCKMGSTQMSVMLYLAGGIVYTIAEIAGGRAKSKSVEENAADVTQFQANMKDGGDLQKKAIDAQIKNEKDNLKHVQTKRKWMMATKLVYAAATAMAVIEIWWSFPPPAGMGKPDAAACSSNPAGHKFMTKAIAMAYGAFVSSGGTLQGMIIGAGMQAGKELVFKEASKKVAETVVQVEAGADVADASVPLLNSAYGRIAFFAAATALVMLIDGDLKKEEEAIKKRIADLEKVKSTFESADNNLAEGASTTGTGSTSGSLAGNNPNNPSNRTYDVNALAQGTQLKKMCMTNNGGSPDYSEAGCSNPLRIQKPVFPGGVDIPTLQNAANVSTDMANAMASGDIAAAEIEAGKLTAMAARIEAVKDNALKKLNDQLKKDGKKPIDVDGELNRQVAALNAELNKRNAGSGNFSMADIGNAGEAATSDIANAADPNAGNITTTAAPVAADLNGPIDLSSLEGELGGTEVVDPNAAGTEKVATLEDSLNDFESNESDIAQDSGVSIFKQVSNRYFLNYTKIFDKKKIADPPLAPQPAKP